MTRRERMAWRMYRKLRREIPDLRVEILEVERLKLYYVEIYFGDEAIAASWHDVVTFAAIRELSETHIVEYYVQSTLVYFNGLRG